MGLGYKNNNMINGGKIHVYVSWAGGPPNEKQYNPSDVLFILYITPFTFTIATSPHNFYDNSSPV